MKHILTIFLTMVFALLSASSLAGGKVRPAPNGIAFPAGYQKWDVIAVAHRIDNNTLRVILGNPIAARAARRGQIKKWPNGAILGKIVWKQANLDKWQTAVVPDKFVHAEFMIKNSKKFAKTGGWGFARWTGLDQKPYGKDAKFVQECFGCHQPVKDRDYVFTLPASLPK